ncbi:MAG: hypothetical protein AMXMBFR8_17440 [Nevskiales bacterium]
MSTPDPAPRADFPTVARERRIRPRPSRNTAVSGRLPGADEAPPIPAYGAVAMAMTSKGTEEKSLTF